jgi:hypothetical protein
MLFSKTVFYKIGVVPLHFKHLLSAGRKSSLLGFACGVLTFPLFPAGVKCFPLHSTTVYSKEKISRNKTMKIVEQKAQAPRLASGIANVPGRKKG